MRHIVIGNWKMNLDFVEAIHLTQQIGVLLRHRDHNHVEVVVAPPAVDIRSVTSVVEADRLDLSVAAQHASQFDHGAYTGEVSVAMLRRLGVTRVIVGHSERRRLFGMSDEIVAATIETVSAGGLGTVLCLGESEDVRDRGEHVEYVTGQLAAAFERLTPQDLVIAYEPVWAIGTGRTAEVTDVAPMVQAIRRALPDGLAESTPILYGGSVVPDVVAELALEGGVDGFLVGGASLKAEEFCAIVGIADDCYRGGR